MHLNSLSESNERLTVLLSQFDWSHGFIVHTFLERHRSAVVAVMQAKQLTSEFDLRAFVNYMAKDKASQIQLE